MTVTYPRTPPSSPGYMRINWRAESAVGISESPFSFEEEIQEHQGQRWRATLTLPPMDREMAAPWRGFLLSLNGSAGTFLMGDKANKAPLGSAGGTPLVNGASQTGKELVTDGWTPNQTGVLKAGDYFQLGSGSTARLYAVVQDVNSNGSGQATLDIWPRLRLSPGNNDPLVLTNPVGQWRLNANTVGWDWELFRFGVVIECRENLAL